MLCGRMLLRPLIVRIQVSLPIAMMDYMILLVSAAKNIFRDPYDHTVEFVYRPSLRLIGYEFVKDIIDYMVPLALIEKYVPQQLAARQHFLASSELR